MPKLTQPTPDPAFDEYAAAYGVSRREAPDFVAWRLVYHATHSRSEEIPSLIWNGEPQPETIAAFRAWFRDWLSLVPERVAKGPFVVYNGVEVPGFLEQFYYEITGARGPEGVNWPVFYRVLANIERMLRTGEVFLVHCRLCEGYLLTGDKRRKFCSDACRYALANFLRDRAAHATQERNARRIKSAQRRRKADTLEHRRVTRWERYAARELRAGRTVENLDANDKKCRTRI